MSGKNKIFPKVKQSLKGFLTDESGKVTKKDVLGISSGAIILSGLGMENTLAAMPPCTHGSASPHSSSCSPGSSQGAVSGYTSGGHVNTTLQGGSFSYTSGGSVGSPSHANWGGHANASAPSGGTVTAYNSGGHLNYISRGSATSQPAITGYSHSSGSSHSSYLSPGICP